MPVYSELGAVPYIIIYELTENQAFRKTADMPLRAFQDNIAGLSIKVGELLSQRIDRRERNWETPTVVHYMGRPKSFYRFMRDNIERRRKPIVVVAPDMTGRIFKLDIHELHFTPSTSWRMVELFKERYLEALNIWAPEQDGGRGE